MLRRKLWLIVAGLLLLNFTVQAQDGEDEDGWKKGGEGILNVSQTSLSQWAEGGVDAFALTANLALFADMKKGRISWENDAIFILGFLNTSDTEGFRKADDVIDIDSKLGYQIKDNLHWGTLFGFNSQFAVGKAYTDSTETDISRFLAPGIVTLSTGIDYKVKDFLSIYFSPVAFKGIIVSDDAIALAGTHGNVVGENFKAELGGLLKIGFRKDLIENVSFASNLELYSNYLENSRRLKAAPQNVDILWVNKLGFKVNKYISATIENTIKYDDEISVPKVQEDGTVDMSSPGTQVKNFIGVGFSYKF